MRIPRPLLAATVAVAGPAAVLALPASPATAASYRGCSSVRDIGPTGSDPADAVSLRAKVTTCRTAQRIARTWGREIVMQAGPAVRIRSYRCTDKITSGRVNVTCTGPKGRVVRWRLG